MRVGVLGGGQLGRMLALAAHPLGIDPSFYEASEAAPAARLGPLTAGRLDDHDRIRDFARGVDVLTYETENIPLTSATVAAEVTEVLPGTNALETAQDRLFEKTLCRDLGLGTAPFADASDEDGLRRALDEVGYPALVKTRREGYDGKGQARVRTPEDADGLWERLGRRPLIVEEIVPFARELAILGVRARDGEIRFYPPVQNEHRDGILRVSIAPAPDVTDDLRRTMEAMSTAILESLDYVGVLALELFEVDGRLLVNEMAPRVHNAGHWTIEGAQTSQFENHLRAITGLPLGDTDARGLHAMVNIIGTIPSTPEVLAVPGAHLHLYGKSPRPNRKLGHITVSARDEHGLLERIDALRKLTD